LRRAALMMATAPKRVVRDTDGRIDGVESSLSPPKKGMNFHTSSILPKTVPGPTDPPSPTKILDRMPVTGAWISCVNV